MTSLVGTAIDDRVVRRRRLKAILLPVEHGGWGLTLEPVVAGLIVAFSLPGLAIGLAIVTAFLARQPLRIAIRPTGSVERARIALTVLAVESGLIAGFALVAAIHEVTAAGIVLLAASPLAVFLLWRDRERRSRDLVAEIAAALFMSSGSVAIVLAGGGKALTAAALGLLIAARSVGAILHVRERVGARRGRPVSRAVPIGFHVVSLGLAVAVVAMNVANLLVVAAFVILLGRTLFPVMPADASKLGWSEVRSGLVALVLISLSLAL